MTTTIAVPPPNRWGENDTLQGFVDRGVAAANAGSDVTVLVPPGRYRESIAIRDSRSGSLTIRGVAGAGSTLLDGTDPLSGGPDACDAPADDDVRPPGGERAFLYPDPPALGTDVWATMGKPIGMLGRRRELVFLGDRALRRVPDSPGPGEYALSAETPLVTYVDFDRDSPERGHHDGDEDATRLSVSVRETGIEIASSRHVRVSGFTVIGYRSDVSRGAVSVTGSSDIELSGLGARDNNWDGLVVHTSSDVTIRAFRSTGNGGSGAVVFRSDSLRIEDVFVSDNNLHARLGGFLDWATAGMKLVDVQMVFVRRFECREMPGNGLWFDYQCEDVRVEQADVSFCSLRGLFLEASVGPFRVSDSRFTGNGDGVFLSSVSQVEFVRCGIADNRKAQISVFTDWGAGRENRRGPAGTPRFVTFEQIHFVSCRFRLPSIVSRFLGASWYDYSHAIEQFARAASFEDCVVVAPERSIAESTQEFWFGLPCRPKGLSLTVAAYGPEPGPASSAGNTHDERVGVCRRVWRLPHALALAELVRATGAFARSPDLADDEVDGFGFESPYAESVAVQDRGFIKIDDSLAMRLSLRNVDEAIVTIASLDDPDDRVLVHYGPSGSISFPAWADGGAVLEVILCVPGPGGYTLAKP